MRAQASDAEVYRSASEGTLTPERVIERAAEGKLVLGEGGLGLGFAFTCSRHA